jgi:drug/metabolite transporter (DMT)-like permease
MEKQKIKAVFYSFLVSLLFVLHFYVAKDVLKSVHPNILGGFRGLVGGILIIFFAARGADFSEQKKFLKYFLLIAFFGFFINQILFLGGLKKTSALNTSIILNTIPVTTALIAMLFRVESFDWRKLGGAILGFSMVTILASSTKSGGSISWGDILIFLSVVCLGIGTTFQKVAMKQGAFPALISGTMLLFGGMALCLISLNKVPELFNYGFGSGRQAFNVIYEVIFSTALTYYLSLEALKVLAPSQSMIFIYAQPLMTSTIDIIFFNKFPSPIIIPVFFGVCISGWLVIGGRQKSSQT